MKNPPFRQQNYIELKTKDGRTPLDFAAENGHSNVLQEYFEHRSTYPVSDSTIHTFIKGVMHCTRSDILLKFIPQMDVEKRKYILYLACRHSNGYNLLNYLIPSQSIFQRLLLESCSSDGFTPIMIAVKYKREQCVELLLKSIPCTEIQDVLQQKSTDLKRTVLHICAEYSNESITDMLLKEAGKNNIDFESKDANGNTPLHICVEKEKGNIHMCTKLLMSKLKGFLNCLQQQNINGLTAFHLATENGHNGIIKEILQVISKSKGLLRVVPESKELIELPDQRMRTSLHIAASKGIKFYI